MSVLPTPFPDDPVEGQPGHFDHSNWVKNSLIAIDSNLIPKPPPAPAGRVLGTTATDTWEAVDPELFFGVPTGAIISYAVATPPTGWALCDGTAHASQALYDVTGSWDTPNLKDKFILGAGSTYPHGAEGGEASVKLSSAESGVPEHTHSTANASVSHTHQFTKSLLAHSHSITKSTLAHNHYYERRTFAHSHSITSWGDHTHPLNLKQDVSTNGSGRRITGGSNDAGNGAGVGESTVVSGGHGHNISTWGQDDTTKLYTNTIWSGDSGKLYTDQTWTSDSNKITTESAAGTHSHSVNKNTAGDAAQAHNNMPPYYALVYIIKL